MVAETTPPASERFRVAYWQAFRQLDSLRLRQWERSRLTLPQLRILFQVRDCPGVTACQLARIVGITTSTTSGLVTKLVDAGLITRSQASKDRRRIPLDLSEAGQALAGELAEYSHPFLDQLAEAIGHDLEAVTAALESLARASDTVGKENEPHDACDC